MANANIFQQYLQPPKSVVDYSNDYAKADQLRNSNAMQSMQLGQAANVLTQRNALQNLVQAGNVDLTTPAGQAQAIAVAPDVAPAMVSTIQSGITSAAKAQSDLGAAAASNASAGKITGETLDAARQRHFSDLATVNTPQDALQWGADGVRLGIISPDKFPAAVQAIQTASQTPEGWAQWKQQALQNSQTGAQQLADQKPLPTEVRLGNVVKIIDMNPHSATFVKEVAPAQAVGVSPDTTAAQQGENARSAAGIQKDFKIAGLDANGNMAAFAAPAAAPGSAPGASPTPGNAPGATAQPANPLQSIVDAIGQGKVSESVALQRMPPAQKSVILNGVMQQYPNYIPGQFDAQKHAILAFGTGAQGQQVQIGNTALNHLDTLRQLAAAQANGNIPLANQIANSFGAELGKAAPTDLRAALTMVGPEITKAVIGAGGGEGDRDNTTAALSTLSKGSPAQAAGTLATIEDIFGGRLSEAARTYQRTTGQTNFNDLLSPAAQAVLARRQKAQQAAQQGASVQGAAPTVSNW